MHLEKVTIIKINASANYYCYCLGLQEDKSLSTAEGKNAIKNDEESSPKDESNPKEQTNGTLYTSFDTFTYSLI